MSTLFRKNVHTVEEYCNGILKCDRVILSKAITLVESKLPSDNVLAETLLEKILPHTGNSLRIGITGVPGAGKSTFIESFGQLLLSIGKKIAVLTIDPSSQRTQGSILGDKTRMERLTNDPNVFVRPSASGNILGGVGSKTRETMLLCEAAGFDIVVIETVGVGQNETNVKDIVDFFLLIMLTGAGDELQGIKRGIIEMADGIIINKADGDNIKKSRIAQRELQNALHFFPPHESGWTPQILTCSALTNEGIHDVWKMISEYEQTMKASGYFSSMRQEQNLRWMHDTISYYLLNNFYQNGIIKQNIPPLEQLVETGKMPAIVAARKLLEIIKNTKL